MAFSFRTVFKFSMRRQFLLVVTGASLIILTGLSSLQEEQMQEEKTTPEKQVSVINKLIDSALHSESILEFGKAQQLVMRQQMNIQRELEGFIPHPGLGVSNYTELIPSMGGKPVRILVVSSWRSGSSFLGQILVTHPATFYHFEPLLTGNYALRYQEDYKKAFVTTLSELLQCNYASEELQSYVQKASKMKILHEGNKRLWPVHKENPKLFQDTSFLSNFCQLFPYHLAKVVRLPLEVAEPLLADESLSLKVVLLVRDPRAVMESRYRADWCRTKCSNVTHHCDELANNYHAAVKFREKYPGRVSVLRYEDFQLDRLRVIKDLFEFLTLTMNPLVEEVLKKKASSVWKTKKKHVAGTDFKDGSLRWRTTLTFDKVNEIQEKCQSAMDLFGYRFANPKDDLTTFYPTKNFTFPPPISV